MLELLAQGSQDPIRSLGEATNWVDLVAIAIVIAALIHGILRGFKIQLVGLIVLIGSLALASGLYAGFGDWLGVSVFKGISQDTAHTVGFAVIFLVGLGIGRGICYLLRDMLERMKLVPYDRFFGALLGALKGAVVVIVILTLLVHFLPHEEGQPPQGMLADVLRSRSFAAATWTKKHLLVFLPKSFRTWVDETFPELALGSAQFEPVTAFT